MKITDLLELVQNKKASDLLISAGAPPILRINGQLFKQRTDPLPPEKTQEIIYNLITPEQRVAFENDKELDLSITIGEHSRFRVNVYYQKDAIAAAFRPIPEEIPSLENLGLPAQVSKLAAAKQGLVLVTGPTGSGKTTTQAALIDLINTERSCHVITVEDPIEYIHEHKHSIVDQREVGSDTKSFANALKYVLRQDPDVILIGEMRDLETIRAALTAAETGHLVFATLHTNDAIQSVDRMIDVFPAEQQQQIRFQLSLTLLAIISQRLLPLKNGEGRILACEMLHNNTAIANLIREKKTHQIYSVVETSGKAGMLTMDKSVKELYSKGLISYEDAITTMRDPKNLDGS